MLTSGALYIFELQKRFIEAREVSQRTSENIVRKHNALVHDVHVMVQAIDEVFTKVTESIKVAR